MLLKTTNRNSQSRIVGNLSSVRRTIFQQGVDDQKGEDCKMSHSGRIEERAEFLKVTAIIAVRKLFGKE